MIDWEKECRESRRATIQTELPWMLGVILGVVALARALTQVELLIGPTQVTDFISELLPFYVAWVALWFGLPGRTSASSMGAAHGLMLGLILGVLISDGLGYSNWLEPAIQKEELPAPTETQ